MGLSKTLCCSRFLPPNKEPIPPADVPDLTLSVSAPGLGEVARRVGVKASFSFSTGETPRFVGVVSMAVQVKPSSVEVSESTRVASMAVAESRESIVSEVMRGEERVSSPAWEWCGDMPGRRAGELGGGSAGNVHAG